ncbi:MAG: endonuclease/exonuclease/phosphatase family protein [Acidobacteriaceae bacterium]|nr:endonuclease/exonuclease/phosphatase family protein [Acidobacteriaceae bacterium]
MIRFSVGTYNVHKCRGIDWRVRPERILKVMREMDTDILAIQEIFEEQSECLASGLEMPHVFAPTKKVSGRKYGNAVFSRLPLLSVLNHDLTVRGREPRGCLQVEIEIARGRTIELFATHLGTSYFERKEQGFRMVSPQIVGQSGAAGRRIVAGDFNEWTRGLATRMLSQRLKSADVRLHLRRARTYPGVIPFLHLDHIYYDQAFLLVRLRLHKTPLALTASDHLPLVADFEWP